MRSFLSPGERRTLEAADAHPLPDDVRSEGYETEGDVIRLFMDLFDARLGPECEPPATARADESAQLLLLQSAPRLLKGDRW